MAESDIVRPVPFDLVQGDTWSFGGVVEDDSVDPAVPIDITGASAKLQVRRNYSGAVLAESSTDNGDITIDGPNGTVTMAMPTAKTALLTQGNYLADLKLTHAGGTVQTLVRVDLRVLPRVTT